MGCHSFPLPVLPGAVGMPFWLTAALGVGKRATSLPRSAVGPTWSPTTVRRGPVGKSVWEPLCSVAGGEEVQIRR